MSFMGRELTWEGDRRPAPGSPRELLVAGTWLFPHSPPGLECYTHVPGGRGILHLPGALAHAPRVLGRVYAGEAKGWAFGGVPRLRLGLLQQEGLQV